MPLEPKGWTKLMREWRGSTYKRNPELAGPLFDQIYNELGKFAAQADFSRTSDPVELVNELYLKWQAGAALQDWKNRTEFFSFARRSLKNLVIDRYRNEQATSKRLQLGETAPAAAEQSLAFVNALAIIKEIGEKTPIYGKLLTARATDGKTIKDIAKDLRLSQSTAQRYYKAALAEFNSRLKNNPPLL